MSPTVVCCSVQRATTLYYDNNADLASAIAQVNIEVYRAHVTFLPLTLRSSWLQAAAPKAGPGAAANGLPKQADLEVRCPASICCASWHPLMRSWVLPIVLVGSVTGRIAAAKVISAFRHAVDRISVLVSATRTSVSLVALLWFELY